MAPRRAPLATRSALLSRAKTCDADSPSNIRAAMVKGASGAVECDVMSTADDYETPRELAARLKIPLKTLYAWRYRGEGPPALKVGRHLRYRARDVERW